MHYHSKSLQSVSFIDRKHIYNVTNISIWKIEIFVKKENVKKKKSSLYNLT